MTAAKLTAKLATYSLVPVILSVGLGIACSADGSYYSPEADPNTVQFTAQNTARPAVPVSSAVPAGVVPETNATVISPPSAHDAVAASADEQAAAERCEKARTDLDTARKRLNAAKAVLKAADAEFKASRADLQAINLRNHAQQLADASGMPPNAALPAGQAAVGGAGVPATGAPAADSSQNFDFSGSGDNPFVGVPTPGK